MSKSVWGPATWAMLHCLVLKIKDDANNMTQLKSLISSICDNLPCPDCQAHATQFLAQVNVPLIISSKENLINFLHAFHNNVNKRIGHREFSKIEHDNVYSRANTLNIIKYFLSIMDQNIHNEKLMMLSFHRKRSVKIITEYFDKNIHKFNT